MTARVGEGDEKRQEPIRIKAKGLLERRGSSASLTIDLLHPSQENLSVTPTREWLVINQNKIQSCICSY